MDRGRRMHAQANTRARAATRIRCGGGRTSCASTIGCSTSQWASVVCMRESFWRRNHSFACSLCICKTDGGERCVSATANATMYWSWQSIPIVQSLKCGMKPAWNLMKGSLPFCPSSLPEQGHSSSLSTVSKRFLGFLIRLPAFTAFTACFPGFCQCT